MLNFVSEVRIFFFLSLFFFLACDVLVHFFGGEDSPINKFVLKKSKIFEQIFSFCLNKTNKELVAIYNKEKNKTKKMMLE